VYSLSNATNGKLSFVTVVYEGELPLLALQARSIERFVPAHFVEEIIILVNDINEQLVIQSINSECVKYYGALASKVKVYQSKDVFTPPRAGWINTLLDYWAKNPQYRFRKRRGGWFGNNGWVMQQAFKLCSARVAKASHIVMLDTKNIFIQDVDFNSFVDNAGKARTNFVPLDRLHKRWLPASCKALKVEYSEALFPTTTKYVTPFVIEKNVLVNFLNVFEQHHDSVQGVFARRFIKPTEFMLINVFCKINLGDISNVFSEGLIQAHSFYTGTTSDQVDSILNEAENGKVAMLGLHITVMGRMTLQQLDRLKNLLVNRGVLDEAFDILAMKDILIRKNEGRIKKSQKKLPQRNQES
jgi:hypothetical protein